ncbi:MAG TPA: HIT family protein [Candidatus Paceibacterota bacterium]|nr:HIT family protein [Candidatus Paceibacterota bacterium]
MVDTIFTKIIKRELPAEILYEDEEIIAILNRFPNMEGETLVITKEQIDYLFDLDDELYAKLMLVTKKVAKALDATFKPIRTCIVIEGLEVPHVHVRLYPLVQGPLTIHSGPMKTDDELKAVADRIRPNL